MSKTPVPIKNPCYQYIDPVTWIVSLELTLQVFGDWVKIYYDCENEDANWEAIKYEWSANLPPLPAWEVMVKCVESKKHKVTLCDIVEDAAWNITSNTTFCRRFVCKIIDWVIQHNVPTDLLLDWVTPHVVSDEANVKPCPTTLLKDVLTKTCISSDWTSPIVIPGYVRWVTITSSYVDATEWGAWYTVDDWTWPQVITDACACKDQEDEVDPNICYYPNWLTITSAPEEAKPVSVCVCYYTDAWVQVKSKK